MSFILIVLHCCKLYILKPTIAILWNLEKIRYQGSWDLELSRELRAKASRIRQLSREITLEL